MDVPNFLCALVGNLNTFDHVTFQLSYVLEIHLVGVHKRGEGIERLQRSDVCLDQ